MGKKASQLGAKGFVQLTRRDKDGSLVPTSASTEVEDDAGASASQPDPTPSFITQVTTRNGAPGAAAKPPAASSNGAAEEADARPTWRQRVRALLCCLNPEAADQYYRSGESESVVVRPPVHPPPPLYSAAPVIGPLQARDAGKKTLVLDLDETLVHSSFKPISNPDYIIPVEIEGKVVDVYVLKRPHMDAFMASIAGNFEIIVFTASLSKYADPLLDLLDKPGVVRWRLFRESCHPYEGNYVKDLMCLGRPLSDTIIVDNSPHSYVFQPENAVPIGTFIDEKDDTELLEILPILHEMRSVDDVREVLSLRMAQLNAKQKAAANQKARFAIDDLIRRHCYRPERGGARAKCRVS